MTTFTLRDGFPFDMTAFSDFTVIATGGGSRFFAVETVPLGRINFPDYA